MGKLKPGMLMLFGAVAALACTDGASGGAGGDGSGGFTCSPPNTRDDAACTMCVETQCTDEYQTICTNQCTAPGPTTPLSPQCMEAEDALGACIDDHCPGCDQEDSDPESGGTGGGSGGSSAGGRGGSGGSSAGAGGASSGQGCVVGMTFCNWYSAAVTSPSAVLAQCNTSGGTPIDHCPSDGGLLGCCVQKTGTVCSYNLYDKDMRIAASCGTAGGVWTTSPP